VIEAAHRLGIHEKLQAYPSLALGAFEVSLLEMTSAYTVFANQGLAFPPYTFERITDANGDPLEKTHPDAREVTTPQASYQLLEMLKGVCQRGTGASAASLQLNIAGKTGTTSEYTDAWFIGMNPRYTVGVWIGNDVKTTLGPGMEGAKVALPVWMRIFQKMKDKGRIDPKSVIEAFVSGSQPTEEWSSKWEEVTRLPWSLQKSFYQPKRGEEGAAEDATDASAAPAAATTPPANPPPPPR
jgi:penicillin-binding protein 1A